MNTIDDMTPRQRTYALKKFDIRIDSITEQYGYTDSYEVCFSDGVIEQVDAFHSCKQFDGAAAVISECREIATYKRLEQCIKNKGE